MRPASGLPTTSLMRRLTLGLTLVVGVSTALVVVLFAASVRRSEDREVHRNVRSSVAEAAELLAPSLWDLDMEQAATIGEAFAQDPRVVRLTIHEATGETRVIRRALSPDAARDTVLATAPVMRDGRVLGDVELVFSRALYLERVVQQVRVAIFVGALVLLVTLGGVRLLLAWLLRRPLQELTATVGRYAEGDYAPQDPGRRYTELRPFWRVLDTMASRIVAQLEELRWRNRELATLNRFLAFASTDLDAGALLHEACRELAELLEMPYAAAMMWDETNPGCLIAAERTPATRRSRVGVVLNDLDESLVHAFLASGAPFLCSDARLDPRLAPCAPRLRRYGVTSMVALPVLVQGMPAGAIVLTSPHPRAIGGGAIALATAIVAQTSGALSRIRARAAERLLRATVEQIPESVVITDTAGRVVYANAAFGTLTGYSLDETLGATPAIVRSGKHEPAFYALLWETLRAGRTWYGQFANRKKSGEIYYEDAVITPVRDRGDVVSHYVRIGRDVTLERERDARLRHAQKLEGIGQLAGGVAHDFNNILGAILLQLELLEAEHALTTGVQTVVRDVRASAERAARLTRQLLMFSRRQAMSVRRSDLNAVVADLLRMLTRIIGERITVVFERADGPVVVEGDLGMLEQVVMNLAVNARDAMPDGGTLTIRTRRLELDDAAAGARPDAYAGRFACLEVRDTGVGMSAETQRRIFEPFFTTKDVGQGTGLGLATTHGIVAQHRGWIEVDSALGSGTSFRVFLPTATAAVERTEAPAAALRGGSAGVLVVEDEASVRRTTARALRRLGYRVLEAADAATALEIVATERDAISLVITDMVMPGGMGGADLAGRLRGVAPWLAVVVMSGYSLELGALPHGELRFLTKPFTLAALSDAVHEALRERAAAPRPMA